MRTEDLLNTIRDENPSHWPNGLTVGHFDGGLYLVKAGSGEDPVGFVGWQERTEDGRRIGYYSVGVLKEHRRRGIAKEALSQMLREKSAGVDEVRALVVSTNLPSKRLARAMNVTLVEKSATAQRVGAAIGGVATPVLMDQLLHPDSPATDSLQPWKWDKFRLINGLLNATFGAAGGHRLGAGDMHGFVPIGMAPTKDLAIKGLGSLHKVDQLVDPATKALSSNTAAAERPGIPPSVLLGALGLGAGALGVAAYSAKRRSDAAHSAAQAQREGRVKVTLPTKNPNDAETILDLPLTDISMSKAMQGRLKRDTKRRLYAETTERTKLRKPKNPDNPSDAERESEELRREIEEDKSKAAAAAPPSPGVPTPPPMGVNPAMRLQGQRTAVQSIDTSTEANPQIMKAQQEAMAAKQEAQMQTAQSQQQQAQAQMESDAAHQQELAKLTGQNQMLQMKLEQEKVRNDLVAEKAKAQQQISAVQAKADKAMSGGQASQVDQVTKSRLKRIERRIKSGSATPPLRHDAMQRLNDFGHEYVARGGMAPVNVWRHSYGKPLDALFTWLAKDRMFRPPVSAVQQAMPFASFINHPDRLGMLASGVLDRGY